MDLPLPENRQPLPEPVVIKTLQVEARRHLLPVGRIELGWSIDELARESRLRSTTISDYEQEKLIPGINSISMMMEALGYPFAALDVARTCIGLLRSTRKHRLISVKGMEPEPNHATKEREPDEGA